MKKAIFLLLSLALLAGCSSRKPVVVKGTIKGYDGMPFLVCMTTDFQMDTILVKEDSTFYFEKYIEEPWTGFICVQTEGSKSAIFIPGETYVFDIDMTAKPSEWIYSGDNQDAMDYFEYYRSLFSGVKDYPETFREYNVYWDSICSASLKKLESVKNRKARKYFEKNLISNSMYYKFNYAFQMRKRGLPLDSDPDFNEFFGSIDLSDENTCKMMLSNMVNVKADLYDNDTPYSLRYLKAVYDISPNRQVRDSVAAKYLESVFRDGRIASREEADTLLCKASEVGLDEAVIQKYSSLADRILSLAPGCEALDFEMEDTSGKIVRLSDLRGKAVYVDFWATWCLPCCMQIPHMEKLAKKYSGDNRIVCISVSLDKDAGDWNEKLAEDKPFWPQYRVKDGGKAIQKEYCFGAIPRFMLFDAEGRIITVDAPRPSESEKIIRLIDSVL